MAQQKSNQELIASVPEQYRHFVVMLKGNPYVLVEGRMAMARDEHEQEDRALNLHSMFTEVAGQWVCVATVQSEIRGSAVGTAAVPVPNPGGKRAEDTNPIEVAETSAYGRALGFLGYGTLGTGIASAQDMARVFDGDMTETEPSPDDMQTMHRERAKDIRLDRIRHENENLRERIQQDLTTLQMKFDAGDYDRKYMDFHIETTRRLGEKLTLAQLRNLVSATIDQLSAMDTEQ